MSEDRNAEPQSPPAPAHEPFEAPAIVSIGKLDQVTFGAAGSPFEGATSYL